MIAAAMLRLLWAMVGLGLLLTLILIGVVVLRELYHALDGVADALGWSVESTQDRARPRSRSMAVSRGRRGDGRRVVLAVVHGEPKGGMMKRIICDTCRVEVEPTAYGAAPEGWLQLTRRTMAYREPLDLCSLRCALRVVEHLMLDEEAKEALVRG